MRAFAVGLLSILTLLLCSAVVASPQEPQPVIRYANSFGGSGQLSPFFATTDSAGNIYLTGGTTSMDFPASVRFSSSTNFFGSSVFVVKIDPSGSRFLFSTVIGGGTPGAIAVDSTGKVYVAGSQAGDGYPTTAGAYSATGNCFVSKLDPLGANLIYSTRLACANAANIGGLAVDSSGNAYTTGFSSDSLVTTAGAYRTTGGGAFALKLNPTGSALVYSTLLPGTPTSSSVHPLAIAIDTLGAAYIAGSANVQSFQAMPDTLPHEILSEGGDTTADAMVLKLSPDGSAMVFASLFGGVGADVASAVAVGNDGSVYVSGAAQTSTGFGPNLPFPTTPAAADSVTGFPKGFVARLTPTGDAFVFSTLLSGTRGAPCLSVTDAGVDVLAQFELTQYTPNVDGTQIMRISPDGTSLIHSSAVSAGPLIGCGQAAQNFVALGSTVTSPNLAPIGTDGNLSFSLITADVPGAPQFEVNTGELNLVGWRTPDGTFPLIQQTIHANAEGRAVPVSVTLNTPVQGTIVDRPLVTTPADITVSAEQGRYNGEVILFAPGTKDGLVRARVNVTPGSILFTLDPKVLPFTAPSGSSVPSHATVHVSTSVEDVFGTGRPVQLNYSIGSARSISGSPAAPLPSWLSGADTGVTPEIVTFTANPAGLPAGLQSTTVQFTGAGPAPPPGEPDFFPNPIGALVASLQIGPPQAGSNPVAATATPSAFTLRFTDPSQQTQSTVVHVTSSAGAASFAVGQLFPWLTAIPLTGQTPADIRFTATPPGDNGSYETGVSINVSGSAAIGLQAYVDVAMPGYAGTLGVQSIANALRAIAPGSLFYIQLNHPERIPAETDQSGLASYSLAGYSFTANGTPVALISYQSGQFLAQMPVDAQSGSVRLDAFDGAATPVAMATATVATVSPEFVADPAAPRAQKADGTPIDATHAVAPGDKVLVHVTGMGKMNPALATGQTGVANAPSSPVAGAVATIGGKNAQVISAQASPSSPGVVDITLAVPDLYDGVHYVSVSAMGIATSVEIPVQVCALTWIRGRAGEAGRTSPIRAEVCTDKDYPGQSPVRPLQ